MYYALREIVRHQKEIWKVRPKENEALQKLEYHSRIIAELSISLKKGQTYVLNSPEYEETYIVIKHSIATVEVSTAQLYQYEQNEIQYNGRQFPLPGRDLPFKSA